MNQQINYEYVKETLYSLYKQGLLSYSEWLKATKIAKEKLCQDYAR